MTNWGYIIAPTNDENIQDLEYMVQKQYDQAFIITFDIDAAALGPDLKYESIQEWDSIGHMGLIAELEDSFDISMEMDDIIDFSSFEKGREILKKYDINI